MPLGEAIGARSYIQWKQPLAHLVFMLRLLFMLTAAAAASAQTVRMIEMEGEARRYWPQWRGPTAQGIVEGKGYPDAWSETENVRWTAKVRGHGHSSPTVWKDRILYPPAHAGTRLVVLCFNRADGKLLWEAVAPSPSTVERLYRKNSHATATPITDGERVYALFGNSGMLAVDFNG